MPEPGAGGIEWCALGREGDEVGTGDVDLDDGFDAVRGLTEWGVSGIGELDRDDGCNGRRGTAKSLEIPRVITRSPPLSRDFELDSLEGPGLYTPDPPPDNDPPDPWARILGPTMVDCSTIFPLYEQEHNAN